MPNQEMTFIAPAKINLFLHILGQRVDGYHNIQTVFQFLDFYDQLTFRPSANSAVTVETNAAITEKDNLVLKAAELLKDKTHCKQGAEIILKKNLPIGGGLGGGSSNAATTLIALNLLWDLKLSTAELQHLAERLGADVPIFLHGEAAWAEGIGNQFTSIILPESWCLLLIPSTSIMTKKIFNDPRLTRDNAAMDIQNFEIGMGHNDFEKIIRFDYPEIAQGIDWLNGFAKARITGSGGVIFALFDTEEEASRIAAKAPSLFRTKVTRVLNQSPLKFQLRD